MYVIIKKREFNFQKKINSEKQIEPTYIRV